VKVKPIAVVTGGAGFIGSHMVDVLVDRGFGVRVIDNMLGGRESNLAHHMGNSDVTLRVADIREVQPGDALFEGALFVFHFAGIGDIVPSIEKPLELRMAGRASPSSSMPPLPLAMASRRRPRARTIPSICAIPMR
jgi:UDP-glucose 4-epimerase